MKNMTDSVSRIPGIIDTASVNEIIREHPESVAVFNRFGIDACCGGATRVREAAERDGADPVALRDALARAVAS